MRFLLRWRRGIRFDLVLQVLRSANEDKPARLPVVTICEWVDRQLVNTFYYILLQLALVVTRVEVIRGARDTWTCSYGRAEHIRCR